VIAVLSTRPALRAAVIGAYILLVEWTRAVASTIPGAVVPAIEGLDPKVRRLAHNLAASSR